MITQAIEPGDPRLAPYRGVRDADLRGRDGLCCVETPRVVRRFLAACARALERGGGAWDALPCVPRSLACVPAALPSLEPILERLPPIPVFVARDSEELNEFVWYDSVIAETRLRR